MAKNNACFSVLPFIRLFNPTIAALWLTLRSYRPPVLALQPLQLALGPLWLTFGPLRLALRLGSDPQIGLALKSLWVALRPLGWPLDQFTFKLY